MPGVESPPCGFMKPKMQKWRISEVAKCDFKTAQCGSLLDIVLLYFASPLVQSQNQSCLMHQPTKKEDPVDESTKQKNAQWMHPMTQNLFSETQKLESVDVSTFKTRVGGFIYHLKIYFWILQKTKKLILRWWIRASTCFHRLQNKTWWMLSPTQKQESEDASTD